VQLQSQERVHFEGAWGHVDRKPEPASHDFGTQ